METRDSQTRGTRFTLSELEMTYVLFSYLVSGDWQDMGVSEEQAREWILKFIRLAKNHGTKAVKGLFIGMQNTLMAHRKDSFEKIQREPFFSPFARSNAIELDTAWTDGGDSGFRIEWNRIFAPGWKTTRTRRSPVLIAGGPGHSRESCLVVVNAPDAETRVSAEYWYLYYTWGRDWTMGAQAAFEHYDVIDLAFADGSEVRVFFGRHGSEDSSGLQPQ